MKGGNPDNLPADLAEAQGQFEMVEHNDRVKGIGYDK